MVSVHSEQSRHGEYDVEELSGQKMLKRTMFHCKFPPGEGRMWNVDNAKVPSSLDPTFSVTHQRAIHMSSTGRMGLWSLGTAKDSHAVAYLVLFCSEISVLFFVRK
jgi:hypothetical protein